MTLREFFGKSVSQPWRKKALSKCFEKSKIACAACLKSKTYLDHNYNTVLDFMVEHGYKEK